MLLQCNSSDNVLWNTCNSELNMLIQSYVTYYAVIIILGKYPVVIDPSFCGYFDSISGDVS